MSKLRIIHACNYYYNRDNEKLDLLDQKISLGLAENGHYILPFSIHDIARQKSWQCNKKAGAKKANLALIETCKNTNPDLLLLGHSQTISRSTLEIIKTNHPNIKIAQWFCDWLYSKKKDHFQFIFNRLDLLDSFFATTAGTHIEAFNQKGCRATFIPNLVHKGIENLQVFKQKQFDYDLVFMGTDKREPERRAILENILTKIDSKFKVGVFGSLENPSIFGAEKESILARSKASLNLTRIPEPMLWYSSDRISTLTGNGLLTCTHTKPKLHELYGEDALLYYSSTEDLIEQLQKQLHSDQWRITAKKGWEIAHERFNAKRITSLMIEFIYNQRDDCLNLNQIQ